MKKIFIFVFSLLLTGVAFSQSSILNDNNDYQKEMATIANPVSIPDASVNLNNYLKPIKANSTAKLVNTYLNNGKSIDLPQFHSRQARVKFIVLSGTFVTLTTLFLIKFFAIKN